LARMSRLPRAPVQRVSAEQRRDLSPMDAAGIHIGHDIRITTKLLSRRLDQSESRRTSGNRGCYAPFFSPDGQWIGFKNRNRQTEQNLRGRRRCGSVRRARHLRQCGNWARTAASSWEPPERPGTDSRWAEAKRDHRGLGNGEIRFLFPQILPKAKPSCLQPTLRRTLMRPSIEVMTLADHHRKTLSRGTSPRYLATSNGPATWSISTKEPCSRSRSIRTSWRLMGRPCRSWTDVAFNGNYGTAQVSFSSAPSGHGTLVYRGGGGGVELLTVAWLDGAGKTQPLLAETGYLRASQALAGWPAAGPGG